MNDNVNTNYLNLLIYTETLGRMLHENNIDPQIYTLIDNTLCDYEQWRQERHSADKILQSLLKTIPQDAYKSMPRFTQITQINFSPYFEKHPFCYVFASNDAYAPYLGVALYSMRENVVQDAKCDICILHTELSKEHQQKILSLQGDNFRIRFIDISSCLTHFDKTIFKTHAHFSKEAYYRFFIPQIFKNYKRVLYLDCDMLFLSNLNDLFSYELNNMPMGAVLEYKFKCKVEYDLILNNYAKNILQLKNVQNYINSGFLIFDIKKLNEISFTKKCIEKLLEIQRPRTVDQCIINSIMQDKIKFLDPCWNLQTHVNLHELETYVSQNDFKAYTEALSKGKIIHFCSPEKPWNSPHVPFADLWWKYAKNTIFYEDIVRINRGSK